jgi:hypothetical protein
MSEDAIDGTVSEKEALIADSTPEISRQVSEAGSSDTTSQTGGNRARAGRHNRLSSDERIDPHFHSDSSIPKFLHFDPAKQQQQQQQHPQGYAPQVWPGPLYGDPSAVYAPGYPYPPYPPPQLPPGTIPDNGGMAAATTYGAIHPAYAQNYAPPADGSSPRHQHYASDIPPPPPFYAYYSAPPQAFSAENQNPSHLYYGSMPPATYASNVHPMMWSQGSNSGARPPSGRARSRSTTNNNSKQHRRIRSSSPLNTDRKRTVAGQPFDEPAEKHQQFYGESNRGRTSSEEQNRSLAEYEVPITGGDGYHESVPFLGRYRDGTSYGATEIRSEKEPSLSHRRVRSMGEPSVGHSLVRFKEEVTFSAPQSINSEIFDGRDSPTAQQQHPLLRKPRRGSAPAIDRASLERNMSYEEVRTGALRKLPHRRVSSESGLPPAGRKIGRHHRRTSSKSSAAAALADFSRRFRTDSASLASLTSTMSVGSVVTDITKSALFEGVTESGLVKFHLPSDNINLIMDSNLRPGTLLKHRDEDEFGRFTEYHIVSSGDAQAFWQDLLDEEEGPCTCSCDNCIHCTTKAQLLPTPRYAMVVEDDMYRRMIKEISDSRTMPCGLFFCGHHEDVSHPSICIAVGVVSVFLLFMVAVACWPVE